MSSFLRSVEKFNVSVSSKRYRYAIVVSVFISATLLVGVLAFFALRAMGRELGCSMTVAYGWGGATGLFRAHMDAHPKKKYPPMSAMPGNLFPALESVRPVMDPANSYSLHCPATAIHVSDQDLEEKFRHGGRSGKVLYAYTNFESLRLGSEFPMTPVVIEKIGETKSRYAQP